MALSMGSMVTDMRASMDNSPSYLAEVILKGVDKGLREIDDAIRQYGHGATPETVRLATQFRDFLRSGREEFTAYAERGDCDDCGGSTTC